MKYIIKKKKLKNKFWIELCIKSNDWFRLKGYSTFIRCTVWFDKKYIIFKFKKSSSHVSLINIPTLKYTWWNI